MAISLVLREGPSGKGAPLTNQEVDANFVSLKDSILSEKTSRENAISAIEESIGDLQLSVDDEVTSRIESDQNLQSQINALQDDIVSQNYVDVSGDTMTGDLSFNDPFNSIESPKLEFSAGTDSSTIHFMSSGEGTEESGKSRSNLVVSLFNEGDEGFLVRNTNSANSSTNLFYVNANILEYKNSKVWHEANDGAGSGLDADTLDGLQATAFAPVVHAHADLYYTKAESEATFAPAIHGHDVLYYTKAEADSNFAPAVHNHADLYYTKAEADLAFAPIVHSHDYQSSSVVLTALSQLGDSTSSGFIRKSIVDGNVIWEISNFSSNQTTYENGSVSTFLQNSPAGDPIVLDQFFVSDLRSVKYMIQATSESDFHVTEVMILQNNTDAFITEFGTLTSNGSLITVSPQVDSVSGICSVIVTPSNPTNTTIKTIRYTIFA